MLQGTTYDGVVNPLFASIATTLSRKLVRHQGRPLRDARRLPLWRLLLDEAVYLAKRAVRPPAVWVWTSAAGVALVVMIAFAEATPGPVVSIGWRTVAAVGAAAAVAITVSRFRHRHRG